VLSLQGDFARHRAALEAAGAEAVRVTLPDHLDGLDALVIPGGESTTMLRLIASTGLRAPLERFVQSKPVMGTCAGVILLGRGSDQLPAPQLGVLDVTVERNAYGRQIDSFHEPVEAPVLVGGFPGVYIRAPRLTRIGRGVEVVARRPHDGGAPGEPVGVRQGRVLGLCFHPELTSDPRFHRWFLSEVAGLLPRDGAAPSPRAKAAAAIPARRRARRTRGARA
jgi:5'-phosphate synthase pdxT subunit